MKLAKTNPYLRSPAKAEAALWMSAKTSSAIEGIRRPFAAGRSAATFTNEKAFVDYWKKRASGS